MAIWTIKPAWKKSVIERNYLTKGDNTVMIETGWRWGEFTVETEDDNPPVLEPGVDLYNCDYDVELVETFDGCWEEVDSDECDEETQEWLEEFLEENSWLDLEEHGWIQDECEMIIDCDIIIEDEEGNVVEQPEAELPEEVFEEKLTPNANWPFDTK
jgi:hypothetical protein